MDSRTIILAIFLFSFIQAPQELSAVNTLPITTVDIENQFNTNSVAVKKPKKMGFLKRWVVKRLAKKIKKLNKSKAKADDSFFKKARIGLGLGLISFILLWVGLIAPWIWIVAGLLALAGDIVCIHTLVRTEDDKEKYKKERRMSTAGLVFSLLTGFLPLALLFLVLLSV